jgi:hypothetical protein
MTRILILLASLLREAGNMIVFSETPQLRGK